MNDQIRILNFNRRPSPVIPEHRPIYKIGQLVLILYVSSRGGKSRLIRLHLFNWAMKESDRKTQLIRDVERGILSVEAWGFDPALSIAIRFAKGEGLIEDVSDGYRLSDFGSIFAKQLLADEQVFSKEKQFLLSVGKKLTESMVNVASSGWEGE